MVECNDCWWCCVVEADESSTSSESDTESTTASITQERRGQRVLAVPAVRRIAMENKVQALLGKSYHMLRGDISTVLTV